LEGHDEGAVFEVRWGGEGLVISAGEDGKVGVWETGDDKGQDGDRA